MSFTQRVDDFGLHNAHVLTRSSAGGIFITNAAGKIDINNTFEERLRLLETDGLPTVRTVLFGENQNRKFKD